mgnify:CR=1 FL=1
MTLCLHLHGPFRVTSGGEIVPSLSRRGQGLLAFLARQPDMRAERGLLADLLWSDRAEAQARASLRQELTTLRQRLPEGAVQADRQAVWLDPGLIRVMEGPGTFLQGFDLPSEGFEDWLRAERSAHEDLPPAPADAKPPRASRPALAALPFTEIGVPPEDMFADGVVEEITGALGRVREFDVVARQSAFALGPGPVDARMAAETLGATYLVEGSIRRAADRVRISVQLVAGTNGRTLWSARFDDRLDDLFDLQDRIAAQVAGQLAPNLRLAEIDRAGARPPADRTAYDLMLTALPHFWTLRPEDNLRAIDLLGTAVDREPEFAYALALKGWAHAQQAVYMWARDPAAERATAFALADRAAELVGDHAPTLTAIGGVYGQAGDDRKLAETYITRALDLDPSNAWALIRKGWMHQYTGEVDAALETFDRGERLSPLDPFLHQIVFGRAATHYRWSEDPTEGLHMIEDGLLRFPGVHWPLRMVAVANVRLGRMDAARTAAARLMAHLPHLTIRYLKAGLPPIATHFNDDYFSALHAAGIPE